MHRHTFSLCQSGVPKYTLPAPSTFPTHPGLNYTHTPPRHPYTIILLKRKLLRPYFSIPSSRWYKGLNYIYLHVTPTPAHRRRVYTTEVEIVSKNEIIFLAKSWVLQREKFILVSFFHTESYFERKRQSYVVFLSSCKYDLRVNVHLLASCRFEHYFNVNFVVVQKFRNHVHDSLKKCMSIIFQEKYLLKNEIFFLSNRVCCNVRSLFL
jgi:hypothetical protein